MATGFVWEELYMWHETGGHGGSPFSGGPLMEPGGMFEGPEPKRRTHNLLEVTGVLDELTRIRARPATKEEVGRVHTAGYIDRIERDSAGDGGVAGRTTPFGPRAYEYAVLAAGGVIEAADAVLDGAVQNAYAMVRPPGHHAIADEGIGFCIFGNVAITAQHLRHARGLGKVAVVDWDVHHGNGTQDAFYDDPSVLTISLHQRHLQIGNTPGYVDERGTGAGEGYNVNVPLPAGSGKGAYLSAMERVVVPALRAFEPEFILVASGVDANVFDPLARMMLYSDAYAEMTRILLDVSADLCDGRLVAAHEGGYAERYSPFCTAAIIETMLGSDHPIEDPILGFFSSPDQELQPHQADAVDEAVAASVLVSS
jgi:acetoin utilization deacetylase AcuC-like enzyme